MPQLNSHTDREESLKSASLGVAGGTSSQEPTLGGLLAKWGKNLAFMVAAVFRGIGWLFGVGRGGAPQNNSAQDKSSASKGPGPERSEGGPDEDFRPSVSEPSVSGESFATPEEKDPQQLQLALEPGEIAPIVENAVTDIAPESLANVMSELNPAKVVEGFGGKVDYQQNPQGQFALQDSEFGINQLEGGQFAIVKFEDGTLFPGDNADLAVAVAADRGLEIDRDFASNRIYANMIAGLEVPGSRPDPAQLALTDGEYAPIVENPSASINHADLIQRINGVDPRLVLAMFGMTADAEGSFTLGQKSLSIQEAPKGGFVIAEVGTGLALPAGNVSLVQSLCEDEGAGSLTADQSANLVYDRLIAGNELEGGKVLALPGSAEVTHFPSSIENAQPAMVRSLAETVGSAAILGKMGLGPSPEVMENLPPDSPITGVYPNPSNPPFPLYVVKGAESPAGRITEGLMIGDDLKATGVLEIVTRVLQAMAPGMSVNSAQASIYGMAFADQPTDPKAFGASLEEVIDVESVDLSSLIESETPLILMDEVGGEFFVPSPLDPEKVAPAKEMSAEELEAFARDYPELAEASPEVKEEKNEISHPHITEEHDAEVVRNEAGNLEVQAAGEEVEEGATVVSSGLTGTEATNMAYLSGVDTPRVEREEHSESVSTEGPDTVEEETHTEVRIDGELTEEQTTRNSRSVEIEEDKPTFEASEPQNPAEPDPEKPRPVEIDLDI
jgi:hypothetical protein